MVNKNTYCDKYERVAVSTPWKKISTGKYYRTQSSDGTNITTEHIGWYNPRSQEVRWNCMFEPEPRVFHEYKPLAEMETTIKPYVPIKKIMDENESK